MQMSTPDSSVQLQHDNIVHLGVRDVGCLYASGYKKIMKNKKWYLIDVQFGTDKSSQDRLILQISDEKECCQYWILCLVVFN